MPQKDKKKAAAACIRSDRKDIFVEKKLVFSQFFRRTKMSTYEIFDLPYSDLIEKLESDNIIFTHKHVVGKQRIRLHLLKPEIEDLDPVEILFEQIARKIFL